MNDESTPKGAHESATTSSIVPDEGRCQRDQLSRIETILDRIVGSLDRHAAIGGAR